MSYLYIAATILLTLYGQLIIKWRVGLQSDMSPTGLAMGDIVTMLFNPWIVSALGAAFGASLCWMAALSRMPLSKAYPFTALSFPLITIFAAVFFQEQIDVNKAAGTALVIAGVVIISRSAV